jgi:hypothetical protein
MGDSKLVFDPALKPSLWGDRPKPVNHNRDERGRLLPGHSGNPKGPRKGYLDLAALSREYTQEALDAIVGIMRDQFAPRPVRLQAAIEVLNRGHGKAPNTLIVQRGKSLGEYTTDQLVELLNQTVAAAREQKELSPQLDSVLSATLGECLENSKQGDDK